MNRPDHGTPHVVGFLRRSARVAPDRPAVVSDADVVDYRGLNTRVQALAQALPSSECGPEAIGVVAEHDAEVPELYLGVMAAGHAVVPISSRLPDHAIAKIANAAGMRMGLLARSATGRKREISATADGTRWMDPTGCWTEVSLPPLSYPLPPGTAMVPFTSGTTGKPKGVVLSHTSLVLHALTSAFVLRLGTTSCHVNPMPLAHFTGASRVVIAMVNAGTHVILPEFEPDAVMRSVEQWRGTHMALVPTMVGDLLAADPERFDISTLETLVYGAAPMPMSIARELVHRMPCGLINGYGLTESCAMATALDADAHRRAVTDGDDSLLQSVGSAVPGVEVSVLDADNHEVPPGAMGEIALRGAKLSSGYLNDEALTSAKFLPSGWLLTGDQGKLTADGTLTLMGRLDDMIISGGLNIQPSEVELEALEYNGVAACAAFGVPSERWGQELHLAVTPAAGANLDPDQVRSFLRSRLHRYKLPKAVHVLDELPMTSVGKIQRAKLRDRVSQGKL